MSSFETATHSLHQALPILHEAQRERPAAVRLWPRGREHPVGLGRYRRHGDNARDPRDVHALGAKDERQRVAHVELRVRSEEPGVVNESRSQTMTSLTTETVTHLVREPLRPTSTDD